jgi:insertion element IS1 protein InsB
VLFYTSRVICKGRLTMEEIIFSLKHYWRFVDSKVLELKALSQGVDEKAAWARVELIDRKSQLKALLEPCGITRYSTDYWGAYTRHLDAAIHSPGKRKTRKIERKHVTLRTRMQRLMRKTICFSKSIQMHDIVIGLFVNRYAFARAV